MQPLTLTDRLYISLKGSGLAHRCNHRGGPSSGQSDPFIRVDFPVFDLPLILLQVFISLNLNCKKYFISVLTTENNELDWENLDSFDLVCYLGGFFATI